MEVAVGNSKATREDTRAIQRQLRAERALIPAHGRRDAIRFQWWTPVPGILPGIAQKIVEPYHTTRPTGSDHYCLLNPPVVLAHGAPSGSKNHDREVRCFTATK
jgi:hypothetical protein